MAERKTYTEEQKAEILKRAEETSVSAAAKEFGVSVMSITRWKAANKATAEKIETKKKTRGAARKAKTTVADTAEKAAGDVKDAADKAKDAVQIEVGKVKGKRTRKVVEKMEAKEKKQEAKEQKAEEKKQAKVQRAAKKPSTKIATAKMNMVFQSTMGGEITPEQIALKLPKNVSDVYVKLEENKAYYVLNDGTMGNVEIW